MSVRRVYVEKKPEYAIKARELKNELENYLGISTVTGVRVLIRYDIENISDRVYEEALATIFSEPPLDEVFEGTFLCGAGDTVFSVEYLPGQFDQRADSAEQCVKLLNEKEEPVIRTATTYVIQGTLTKEQAESPLFNPQLNNNVDFELERVVAKAAVTGPMSAPLTLRGEQVGTFYFDYYTVTRQPDRFYALSGAGQNPPHTIFLNNGTYSTDANADENIPIGLRSRIDEAYDIGIYEYGVIGQDGYRDGYPSVYKVLRVSDANTPLNKLYGIYLPENFLTSGDEMRWFNTSHFKVYGVFDPNADLFVDAELYKSNADKRPAGWDHTFYYNKTLNRFCYKLASLSSVNTSTEAEREQMKPEYWYKYTNGRGFYRTPVHVYPADADFNLYSKPVTNADVVRNNFYIVDITGISDMPSNWDNVDSGNPGLTADGRRKHGNSDYPSHLFRDEDHRYDTEADLGHTQGADLITPPDYVGLTRDVPNLKYNYEWGNQLYIAKPTDGKTDKPYDNIDENTPINSKRVTLRVRARVMRWNVRMVDSPMGLGDASTY